MHISHGMIPAICLAACAAVASGLTQPVTQIVPRLPSVLILGSSVDRYATEIFCKKDEKFFRVQCIDHERGLNVGFWFHPGVGLTGDLTQPFYNNTKYGAKLSNPIANKSELIKLSIRFMGHEFPDLVVVDSSLWDIATWTSQTGKNMTDERLKQWGETDLVKLLFRVSEAFPKSRIVFRTAPTVYDTKTFVTHDGRKHEDVAVFSPDSVYKMNNELYKHIYGPKAGAGAGKLYGKFEVLYYNKIMNALIKERGFRDPTLWLKDGYHPCPEASKRYFNKILQLMNMTTVEEKHLGRLDEKPKWQPAIYDEFP